jgi:hypothetical protein
MRKNTKDLVKAFYYRCSSIEEFAKKTTKNRSNGGISFHNKNSFGQVVVCSPSNLMICGILTNMEIYNKLYPFSEDEKTYIEDLEQKIIKLLYRNMIIEEMDNLQTGILYSVVMD